MLRAWMSLIAVGLLTVNVGAEDPVFSGPQVGEKLTPFKVRGVLGPQAGQEVNLPGREGKGTLLIFIHEWTRPTLQLMRPVDAFAERWAADGLTTHIVQLSADREKAEMFLQNASKSLSLKSPASVSLDGLEGPGNYGLNRKMTVTILVAKDNKVVANFAIIQPNETDAPKVLKAVADLLGKPAPTAEEVAQAATGGRRPVANPTERDPELVTLMRQMIQKDNDEAKVKDVAQSMMKWAGDNPRKQTQLVEYCKQVIGLGYGNEHAKKALQRLAGAGR